MTIRRKTGVICITAGLLLILGALMLYSHNRLEQANAERAVSEVLPSLIEQIEERAALTEPSAESTAESGECSDSSEPSVDGVIPAQEQIEKTVIIDGYSYIGYIGIPSKDLLLPVMSDWSYKQLKLAPCRFSGGVYTDDLVLMAHYYDCHFGALRELSFGDTVNFTDAEGKLTEYTVVLLEQLSPDEVSEMTYGGYDLTLFTCTSDTKSRIAVRCEK